MKRLAQASVEYLVIVAIATFLLIPVISLFYSSSVESMTQSNSNLMTVIGRKIVSESENVYYQGKDSKLRLTFNFPAEITNLTIYRGDDTGPYELVFNNSFNGFPTDVVFFSHVNMTFSDMSDPCGNTTDFASSDVFREGVKDIYVHSCGKFVAVYLFNE